MPESEPSMTVRELLSAQLAIPWSLVDTFVLPGLDEFAAHWQPSTNVCAVRQHDDGTWTVDFPDETMLPLPDVTAAWLLWHITWSSAAMSASVRQSPSTRAAPASSGNSVTPASSQTSGTYHPLLRRRRCPVRRQGLSEADR